MEIMEIIKRLISIEHRDILKLLIKYFTNIHYDILLVSDEVFYNNLMEQNRVLYDDYVYKKFGDRSYDLYHKVFEEEEFTEEDISNYDKIIKNLMKNSIEKMRLKYKKHLNSLSSSSFFYSLPILYLLKESSSIYILGDGSNKFYSKRTIYAHSWEESLLTINEYYNLAVYEQREDADENIIYLILYILINTIGLKNPENITNRLKMAINEIEPNLDYETDIQKLYYPIKLNL